MGNHIKIIIFVQIQKFYWISLIIIITINYNLFSRYQQKMKRSPESIYFLNPKHIGHVHIIDSEIVNSLLKYETLI